MKKTLALPTLYAMLLITGTSWAQPSDAAHTTDAERLFREGRALMESGDLAHACPKFAESEKLDPAPGTLLSLADCEEREHALVKAREHYQLAASGFPKKDPRRAFATGRSQALEKRLAHVILHLPPDAPAEASLRIGDQIVARADIGANTVIDPGELHVRVSAPGRKDNALTLSFAEGETKEVLCDLGPPEAAAAIVPVAGTPSTREADDGKTSASKTDPRRTVAFVLLGVGAASIVVGAVSGILATSKASTVKDHCDASYNCDQEGVDAASSGRFLSPLSTVTLIAGAALVGAGAYFFVVSSPNHKQPSARARALLQALQLRGTF